MQLLRRPTDQTMEMVNSLDLADLDNVYSCILFILFIAAVYTVLLEISSTVPPSAQQQEGAVGRGGECGSSNWTAAAENIGKKGRVKAPTRANPNRGASL